MGVLVQHCSQLGYYLRYLSVSAENGAQYKIKLLIENLPPSWRKCQVKSKKTRHNLQLKLLVNFLIKSTADAT